MAVEIRTAVFPGRRPGHALPARDQGFSPKEMLPIVDKPLIQYAVDEAFAAGAERLVFITGSSKRAIEDHFDTDDELEKLLESQGKTDLAEQVRGVLPELCLLHLHPPARAAGPRSRGAVRAPGGGRRAVLRAPGRRSDRCAECPSEADGRVYEQHGGSVLGVEEVPRTRHRQVRHRRGRARGGPGQPHHAASSRSPSPTWLRRRSRSWDATC